MFLRYPVVLLHISYKRSVGVLPLHWKMDILRAFLSICKSSTVVGKGLTRFPTQLNTFLLLLSINLILVSRKYWKNCVSSILEGLHANVYTFLEKRSGLRSHFSSLVPEWTIYKLIQIFSNRLQEKRFERIQLQMKPIWAIREKMCSNCWGLASNRYKLFLHTFVSILKRAETSNLFPSFTNQGTSRQIIHLGFHHF